MAGYSPWSCKELDSLSYSMSNTHTIVLYNMCIVFYIVYNTYYKHHLVILKQVGKASRFDLSHVTILVTDGAV